MKLKRVKGNFLYLNSNNQLEINFNIKIAFAILFNYAFVTISSAY
ncbi:hypothetical protein LCGC14_1765330 [marine sediment metagenome]|uniref:Uncharacterized protein n=1 Tax=marine sediment metagenome TaxID=412755 RepID=A0A0F9JZK9_9ZZZZ